MEKSQVNEKYVLTLVENSDATLSVRRMDIPSSEVPIAELEAMVDNPNYKEKLRILTKLRKKVLNHLLL